MKNNFYYTSVGKESVSILQRIIQTITKNRLNLTYLEMIKCKENDSFTISFSVLADIQVMGKILKKMEKIIGIDKIYIKN